MSMNQNIIATLTASTVAISNICSLFISILTYISTILIFRKAGDEGIGSYIPGINTIKLFWKANALNTIIIGFLLVMLGAYSIGFSIVSSQQNSIQKAGFFILIGVAIFIVAFVVFLMADIKLVKTLEEKPGFLSYIACIFFCPFYLLYNGVNKKPINFSNDNKKITGSILLGCGGLIIVMILVAALMLLVYK